MANRRFVLRLLARAESFGVREAREAREARDALLGDLMEEIAAGRRSRLWIYQQLAGLYALSLVEHVRGHARLTPHLVALALGIVLLGGVSLASIAAVVETWLGFYLVAGTLSLFADMLSHTVNYFTATVQLTGTDSGE